MSVLSIAFPVEAIAANTLNVTTPLLGLGILAALMLFFQAAADWLAACRALSSVN